MGFPLIEALYAKALEKRLGIQQQIGFPNHVVVFRDPTAGEFRHITDIRGKPRRLGSHRFQNHKRETLYFRTKPEKIRILVSCHHIFSRQIGEENHVGYLNSGAATLVPAALWHLFTDDRERRIVPSERLKPFQHMIVALSRIVIGDGDDEMRRPDTVFPAEAFRGGQKLFLARGISDNHRIPQAMFTAKSRIAVLRGKMNNLVVTGEHGR